MSDLPEPPTREERQQRTRAALIEAARDVFADMGYHAANLDRIARQAGFSKGAVYSNFSGKSQLFLAVLDANLDTVWAQQWDSPVPGRPDSPPPELLKATDELQLEAVIRGFALATLEFIAVAARDEQLSIQLQQRIQDVVDQYIQVAKKSQPQHDDLTPEEVGALLTALDQGSGLLLLGGASGLDDDLLGAGMQRLLSPARPSGQSHEGSSQGSDNPVSEEAAKNHA